MTRVQTDQLEACSAELNRLAAMLDLMALGTENMGKGLEIDAAIDGAADFLRYIRQSIDGITDA